MSLRRQWAAITALSAVMISAGGVQAQDSQSDLMRLDVEDLLKIKVTSVSKREQPLSRTAAAVFVVNQEEIRRSGATNIPDILRMVPGVDVEQIDANAWAISIRGFNSRYSNKVLVLIDGRTVYTPSFSGVYWEQIDMPVENIDRIEVIRGPGSTVWGANAVNGVISIFTKSAKQTRGGMVTAATGTQLHALGTAQYGGGIGSRGAYRVFGNYFNIGNNATANGSAADDHWHRSHIGFRTDRDLGERDSLMLQGDVFANNAFQTRLPGFISTPFDQTFTQPLDTAGGDILARWNHTTAGGSQTTLQTYYDSYRRTDFAVPETLRSFDVDFQHHVSIGDRHDLVWGLGYRVNRSALAAGYSIHMLPPSRTDRLYSGFIQDEIRLSDSLWFTLGTKLEHNPYTGLETEPSARLLWNPPGSSHAVWAAAGKSIRQPARADNAIVADMENVPLAPGMVQVVRLYGNPEIRNEELRDFEAGYRGTLTKSLSIDVSSFLSIYRRLETAEPQNPVFEPGLPFKVIVPLLYDNKAHAIDYGGEASLKWNVNSRWQIAPGYSHLHVAIQKDATSRGFEMFSLPTCFPQKMFTLRSTVNVTRTVEFDQSLHYTARLPGGAIPGHTRVDVRLAKRLAESGEVSLVGQNLLRPRTVEYGDCYGVIGTLAPRSVYAKLTWRF